MTLHTLLDRFDVLMDAPESMPKLRQFILQLAVQGKLTEQDPSDEPAEQLLECIEAEKQRLYEEGEIRKPNKFPEVAKEDTPFRIPEGWIWTRLGEIGDWGAGSTPKRSETKYWNGGTIPWLKIGDLNNGYVTDTEEKITQLARDECTFRLNEPGDIVIAMYGSIGKLGILSEKCVTNQAICACTPFGNVPGHYLFNYLRAAKDIFVELGAGGAQQNISKTKIVNTPFPLPPLEEQQRIVAAVERLMDECDTLEAQQQAAERVRVRCTEAATHALRTADTPEAAAIAWHRLRDHFDALCATPDDVDAVRQTVLQLAVQGKLTEQDPSDEPAEKLLARIRSTMQSLDDAGKIWRWKKMPDVPDNERSFVLPDGWMWARLGDLMNISSGNGLTSVEMNGGGIPVYGGNGVTGYHDMHNIDHSRIVIGRVGFSLWQCSSNQRSSMGN